jgi:A/G-specific adenine glycosylase
MIHKKKLQQLQKIVWKYYRKSGRHALPWRKTKNPYHILVSELMLQQTQVVRVIPKYRLFLKTFPTIHSLAHAPLKEVLVVWQGLGYNRRAKFLLETAQSVVHELHGRIPRSFETLKELKGVGAYTAAAVCVFSYNIPVAMIETNIRTVFFHHFFQNKKSVRDSEILQLSQQCMDTDNPREWFWALMDYGAFLKESGVQMNSLRKGYRAQAPFKGSNREVRGSILRLLTQHASLKEEALVSLVGGSPVLLHTQLLALKKEGLVQKKSGLWFL